MVPIPEDVSPVIGVITSRKSECELSCEPNFTNIPDRYLHIFSSYPARMEPRFIQRERNVRRQHHRRESMMIGRSAWPDMERPARGSRRNGRQNAYKARSAIPGHQRPSGQGAVKAREGAGKAREGAGKARVKAREGAGTAGRAHTGPRARGCGSVPIGGSTAAGHRTADGRRVGPFRMGAKIRIRPVERFRAVYGLSGPVACRGVYLGRRYSVHLDSPARASIEPLVRSVAIAHIRAS
jgi:hypothetical protein